MVPRKRVIKRIPDSVKQFLPTLKKTFGDNFCLLEVVEKNGKKDLFEPKGSPIASKVPAKRIVKDSKQIISAVVARVIKNFENYKEQGAYVLKGYCPKEKKIVDVRLFKTRETYHRIKKAYKEKGLYPLLVPNPVKVPKEFWEEYRRAKNNYKRLELVKEYKLLTDESILQIRVLVIDIDSKFEDALLVWEEVRKELGIEEGYVVVRTKSGRFRAYINIRPREVICTNRRKKKKELKLFYPSIKRLKRAKELVAIILAYFEKKGLKSDVTFLRINHPIFPEGQDYEGKKYQILEYIDGYAGRLHELYRKAKEFQKKENLWYLNDKYLPKIFWGKEERKRKDKKNTRPKIIKAPAFMKMLEEKQLDVLELWKRAVYSLSRKHSRRRYIHVIQPAVGWAKYLGIEKEEVEEYLVSVLGEEKRIDIEKGWKYVKEGLEFQVPDRIEWKGKTREEWEEEVKKYLKSKGGFALRQELIREVFRGQEWLVDMIMWGLVKKGVVEWRKYWEKEGKGRKPYVFSLKSEEKILPKAVGAENDYIPIWLKGGKRRTNGGRDKKHKNTNSPPKGGEKRSGLDVDGNDSSITSNIRNYMRKEEEEKLRKEKVEGNFSFLGIGKFLQEEVSMSSDTFIDYSRFDEEVFQLLKDKRVFFDLYVGLDRKVSCARIVDFSISDRTVEFNSLKVNVWDINRLEFTGTNAVKFFKEVLPELPDTPLIGMKLFEGKTVNIYPFGERGYQRWILVKEYPYFFVLYRKQEIGSKGRKKGRKVKSKVVHTYAIKYKLFTSAYAPFFPYPKELISEDVELYDMVQGGRWRNEFKSVVDMLREEMKGVREKLITFALKDGREITGLFRKDKSYIRYCYRLFSPKDENRSITIYKHAIDDFWEV
jgi:hypothetical protein